VTKRIGIGVIGLGGRGIYLSKAFDADPRASLVAVCDKNPQRLRYAQGVFGASTSFWRSRWRRPSTNAMP